MRSGMYKTAYWLFLAALIFAPLAFGTVETWSYTVMELMICASAGLLFFSLRNNRLYKVPAIIPLLFISGAILFQVVPLPASLVRLISPESYSIYQNTAGVLSPLDWMPISVYPRTTLMAFLRFSTYVLFYAAAIQFFSNSALLKRNLSVVTGFGALLGFFVIIEFFTRIMNYPLPYEKILFIRDSVHGSGAVGPYVNRNHYAGLMEMLFPLVLAGFLVYRPVMAANDFKKQISDIFFQKQVSRHFLYGTAAILIATSLFVTLSRGGIISLTLSMGLFAVFLILKTRQKRVGWAIVAIFFAVLWLTGTNAWDMIFERFGNIRNEAGEIWSGRFIYWDDSVEIIRDFPLFGAGAGTFEHIYPKYGAISGNRLLEHAHNDYLEFLSTGGIIIPALMLSVIITILYKGYQSYRRRREPYAIYLFAGSSAAVFSILLHSFVEFNMQVGANGLYLFLIFAVLVSAANTRFRNGIAATYLKYSSVKWYIPLLGVLALIAGVLYVNFGALLGNYHFAAHAHINIPEDITEKNCRQLYQAARRANKTDSLNPRYYHVLANTAVAMNHPAEAKGHYKNLLQLAPLNSRYLQDAGYFFTFLGQKTVAEQLLSTALRYDPKNIKTYLNYTAWLFEEKETAKGVDILQSAMAMPPGSANPCLTLMAWYGLEYGQMKQALPDRVLPHLAFADYLLSKGQSENAELFYTDALDHLPNEDDIKTSYFLRVYRFYQNNGAHEKALHVIQRAIDQQPGDARLHSLAGKLYETLDMPRKAEEEFRMAEILDGK